MVQLKYKNWSTDEEWLPRNTDEPLQLFRLTDDGQKQCFPHGNPELVEPNFNRKQSLEAIKFNIEKMKSFLSFQEWEWWQSFLEKPEEHLGHQREWYLNCLNSKEDDMRHNTRPRLETNIANPLDELMAVEREIPRVCCFRLSIVERASF